LIATPLIGHVIAIVPTGPPVRADISQAVHRSHERDVRRSARGDGAACVRAVTCGSRCPPVFSDLPGPVAEDPPDAPALRREPELPARRHPRRAERLPHHRHGGENSRSRSSSARSGGSPSGAFAGTSRPKAKHDRTARGCSPECMGPRGPAEAGSWPLRPRSLSGG